jgi:hypothetical protein
MPLADGGLRRHCSFVLITFCLLVVPSCAPEFGIDAADPFSTRHAMETEEPYIVLVKENWASPVAGTPVAMGHTDRAAKEIATRGARELNGFLVQGVARRNGITPRAQYTNIAVGFVADLTYSAAQALSDDPAVEGVYPDEFMTFQEYDASLQTVDTSTLGSYFIDKAILFAGGPVVVPSNASRWIWIIDSGIDLDHPDLNVITNTTFARSFTTATPDDDYGHGSLVAGIAAAKHNTFGVSGVAAGAPVVPVKVGEEGFLGGYGAQLSNVLLALDHVADFNLAGDVVNLSLGRSAPNECANQTTGLGRQFRDAIQRLGFEHTWVVIGAGNDENCTGADTNLPACINGYKVYTVGAIGVSSDGETTSCDSVTAWGSSVDWSAIAGRTSTYKHGQYAFTTGTSMATPVIAAIAYLRDAAPVSAGGVTCCSATRNYGNASALSTRRFRVRLQLSAFNVGNVQDADGTEDIFGALDFQELSAYRDLGKRVVLNSNISTMFSRPQSNPLRLTNGVHPHGTTVTIASSINYYNLLAMMIKVGGEIKDEEGIFSPRPFVCMSCPSGSSSFVTRLGTNSVALGSLQALNPTGGEQAVRFNSIGSDFFIVRYAENGNISNGYVDARYRVLVTPL